MQPVSDASGRFVWFELMTTDVAGAKAFYKQVIGFETEPFPMGDGTYEMWKTPNGTNIGGIMVLPEEAKAMGAPPHWLGNLCVANVDAAVAKAKAHGAAVHMGPFDVPSVGRVAIIADPTGAHLALYQPADQAPGHGGNPAPGEVGWCELTSSDPEKAWSFYQDIAGWVETSSMDMGDMGKYRMFGPAGCQQPIGGMMGLPPGSPMSAWGFYLTVADFDAAVAAVKEHGGTVLNGPMEVPGGQRIVHFLDPQGAYVSIVGN